MRIRMNDQRERLLDNLMDVTGHGTKSGAIDAAARHYCKLSGYNVVRPNQGAIGELMELAVEKGSVTPEEIAAVLDTEEYPIEVDLTVHHGPE